jgi:hypothetical protein
MLTGWAAAEAVGRPLQEVFCVLPAEAVDFADNPVVLALAKGVNAEQTSYTALVAKKRL